MSKTVQGTYIDSDLKRALAKEAKKRKISLTRLASEILERAAVS